MKIQNTYPAYQTKEQSKGINKKALIGTTIGTILPVCAMMRKQKTFNPFKLDYKVKDMLILSGTSIAGGSLFGMIGESPNIKKKKFREGSFQFINATLPALFVAGGLKLCERYERFNNAPAKITAVIGGIILGMYGAVKAVNKIFDPRDIYPDRKLTAKDCIANADDALGALTLAKCPFVTQIKLDKLLPIAYAYCGYRAGK